MAWHLCPSILFGNNQQQYFVDLSCYYYYYYIYYCYLKNPTNDLYLSEWDLCSSDKRYCRCLTNNWTIEINRSQMKGATIRTRTSWSTLHSAEQKGNSTTDLRAPQCGLNIKEWVKGGLFEKLLHSLFKTTF